MKRLAVLACVAALVAAVSQPGVAAGPPTKKPSGHATTAKSIMGPNQRPSQQFTRQGLAGPSNRGFAEQTRVNRAVFTYAPVKPHKPTKTQSPVVRPITSSRGSVDARRGHNLPRAAAVFTATRAAPLASRTEGVTLGSASQAAGSSMIRANSWSPASLSAGRKGLVAKAATPAVAPRVDTRPKGPRTSGPPVGEIRQCDGPVPWKRPPWNSILGGTPNNPAVVGYMSGELYRMLEDHGNPEWDPEYWEWIAGALDDCAALRDKLASGGANSSPSTGRVTAIPVSPLGESNGTRSNDEPINGMPLPPGSGGGQAGQGGSTSGGDGKGGEKSVSNDGGGGNSGGNGSSSNSGQSTGQSEHGNAGNRESNGSSGGGGGGGGGGDGGGGGGGNGEAGGGSGGGRCENGESGPADVGEAIDNVQRECERTNLPPADPATGGRGTASGANDVGALKLPQSSRDNRPGIQRVDVRTGPTPSLVKTKTGPDDKQRPDTGHPSGSAGTNRQETDPGSLDKNDVRGDLGTGNGGAEVAGWYEQLWWYVWGSRAQPPK